jgi:hypothetical protein
MPTISNGVAAYVVYPDGRAEHTRVDGQLDTLQHIVEGPIEFVFVTHGVHAYLNEEGKINGTSQPNPLATRLAGYEGVDLFFGPVIFLGDGPDGEEGDLPDEWKSL